MSSDPFDRAVTADEFEVDLSQAESNVIPEGIYLFKVVDVTKAMSKNSNPMFVWEFEVFRDEKGNRTPHAGMRPKLVHTVLTPKALWKLEEILVALGVTEPGGKVKFTRADVIDRFCLGAVEHEDYQNRPQANITAFKRYEGGVTGGTPGSDEDLPF